MRIQKNAKPTEPTSPEKDQQTIVKQTESGIDKLVAEAIEAVRNAAKAVEELSRFRTLHKMSNSRTNSVVRELKELGKVLSLYERR